MNGIYGLTEEQRAFASHLGGAFLHACPGAGKTRSIIERLANIAANLPARHGVAVLSFTNSAVDEFKERCRNASLDAVLKHPSFIGTLDSFVRHFILLPGYAATCATKPILVDSWSTLGIEIRLAGQYAFRGDPVSLDLFDPETNLIDPEKIGHTGLRNHVRQNKSKYEQAASNRRNILLNKGYISTGDARVQTIRLISDPLKGKSLGLALAGRFKEIMVDEGQDCNPADLQILSWLKHYGVHITFVCDPNQAIYEFRKGNPAEILAFKSTYPPNSHLELTGNFRSSPVICKLAATLKNNNKVDGSLGDTKLIAYPVLLITYKGIAPTSAIGKAFLDRILEIGMDSKDAIILAHAGKYAQRAAGNSNINDLIGNSRIELLAHKIADFWSPAATPRSRELVVQWVEKLLLQLMGAHLPGEHILNTIQRLSIDGRLHRRLALIFLTRMPKNCGLSDADKSNWISNLYNQIEQLGIALPAGVSVRRFFPVPSSAHWSNILHGSVDLGIKSATIHEVKGHQFGSVCVVVPPNRAPENRIEILFQSWINRNDTEAKRVIYVGVTRARFFGALAVPISYADRCAELLKNGGTDFTRQDLKT